MRRIAQLFAGLFVFTAAIAAFYAQNPTASPEPDTSFSPSPTTSPTPPRAPSPTPVPVAQNFHQWGSVSVFNGLPSDAVRAIAQTPDGVMWFGTDNGLSRFDGRTIRNFTFGDSLSNNVLVLRSLEGSRLFVGTRSGAFIFENSSFQPIDGTQQVGITSFLNGSPSIVGTDSGLLFSLDLSVQPLTARALTVSPVQNAEGLPLPITGLIESNGRTYASTPGRGLFVFRDGELTELAGLRGPMFVNSLEHDSDSSVLIGADAPVGRSGLYRLASGPIDRLSPATSTVLALRSDAGVIWSGTAKNGLFRSEGEKPAKNYTFENTSGGLRSDTVYALFTDREGVLWIGTNRGVSRFDNIGLSHQPVSSSPNGNFIRTLFRANDGTIYAGSNRGLYKQNENGWEQLSSYGDDAIFSLDQDRTGKVLVGSSTSPATVASRVSSKRSETWGFADLNGEKYAAVHGVGLVRLSTGAPALVQPDPTISSIRRAGNKLFFGTTQNGLFAFDGKKIDHVFTANKLQSGTIWSIIPGDGDEIWLAADKGVFRLKGDGVERIIDVAEARDVYVTNGRIWAATTTRGLVQARFDERFGWLTSSVAWEQGLPSEKAFAILPVDSKLMIATNRGVVTYVPGSVEPKIITSRILSYRVHDVAEAANVIPLEYPQNGLLIEVAGQSSRTFPEEFQYAFVLTNSKGEMIDKRVGNEPQFAPTSLPPGNYSIEAVAVNRDLLASEPLIIRFSVDAAPFPWTATALGVLLVLALVALAWAFAAHRRATLRNRELAAARLSLSSEAERERSRIARDLHDQTLADLRRLMLMSDDAKLDTSNIRGEIESISAEVRRICEDLSPSALENVGLIPALESLLRRTTPEHRFSADETLHEDLDLPRDSQLQVYRIAQEVLSNIKRHSDASFITMEIKDSEDKVTLSITDDGKPFQPDETAAEGRGIPNIKARASMISSTIEWAGWENGNRFTLEMPHGIKS